MLRYAQDVSAALSWRWRNSYPIGNSNARQQTPDTPTPSLSSFYLSRLTAPWLLAILLVLVTLAVLWQVQNSEFVLWDDGLHIFENPYLHSLTWHNILAFWREPYAELYIPFTYTLWALTAAVCTRGDGQSNW